MFHQVEEFGRDVYKLFKIFKSKAKQRAGGGGVKQDTVTGGNDEEVFAPVKVTQAVQDSIKQFKVIHLYVVITCNYEFE